MPLHIATQLCAEKLERTIAQTRGIQDAVGWTDRLPQAERFSCVFQAPVKICMKSIWPFGKDFRSLLNIDDSVLNLA